MDPITAVVGGTLVTGYAAYYYLLGSSSNTDEISDELHNVSLDDSVENMGFVTVQSVDKKIQNDPDAKRVLEVLLENGGEQFSEEKKKQVLEDVEQVQKRKRHMIHDLHRNLLCPLRPVSGQKNASQIPVPGFGNQNTIDIMLRTAMNNRRKSMEKPDDDADFE